MSRSVVAQYVALSVRCTFDNDPDSIVVHSYVGAHNKALAAMGSRSDVRETNPSVMSQRAGAV